MLGHLCVAFDPSPAGRWALTHASFLARRTGARLTVVHVTPPEDGVLDESSSLADELLPVRDDVRCRQQLVADLASSLVGVAANLWVATGPLHATMLDAVRTSAPDAVVLGAQGRSPLQGLVARPLRDTLLAEAPCPVILVRSPNYAPSRAVLALQTGTASDAAVRQVARELGDDLGAATVEDTAPAHGHDDEAIARVAATCDRLRPLLTVIGGDNLPVARRRLGCSVPENLGEATPWPLLVLPRRLTRMPPDRTYRVRTTPRGVRHGLLSSADRRTAR